jgi:SAM-dependent methyltransferase
MSEVAPRAEKVELAELRDAIRAEYGAVAIDPEAGYHFNARRELSATLGYKREWLDGIPEESIAALVGTGNPFALGALKPGENVIDMGCGGGIDSLIAAKMVCPTGKVIGVDMIPEMLDRARAAAVKTGLSNVEFIDGVAESLPVPDGWADVVISNGVLNLLPDKVAGIQDMYRALKPTGRLQIADITVSRAVPDAAKLDLDLWTG